VINVLIDPPLNLCYYFLVFSDRWVIITKRIQKVHNLIFSNKNKYNFISILSSFIKNGVGIKKKYYPFPAD
jgi:hypothetical protein